MTREKKPSKKDTRETRAHADPICTFTDIEVVQASDDGFRIGRTVQHRTNYSSP
jgi:hypothetical protein